MIFLPSGPTVTISEIELPLPVLARRYAEAIGESVDVLPAVERRAVAVFVENEPWDRVLRLAGEAAGFRLERDEGRLRFASSRPMDAAEMEREIARRIGAELVPPDDAATAIEAFRAAIASERERVRQITGGRVTIGGTGKPPPEVRQALDRGGVVSSPASLAIARFVARGGLIPLGRTVVLDGRGLLTDEDYRATSVLRVELASTDPTAAERWRTATYDASALVVALRLTPDGAFGTLTAQRSPGGARQVLQSDVGLRPPTWSRDAETARFLTEHPLDARARPAPRFGEGRATIGDYLLWRHRSSGVPCVGPALRIGVAGVRDPRDFSLPEARGEYRLRAHDGALIATSPYGDGLWPYDFLTMDRAKSPGLPEYVRAARDLKPSARALIGFGSGRIVGPHDLSALSSGLPILRFLGGLSPVDVGRVQSGGRFDARSLGAASAGALRTLFEEDLTPLDALHASETDRMFVELKVQRSNGTRFVSADGTYEDRFDGDERPGLPELDRSSPLRQRTEWINLVAKMGLKGVTLHESYTLIVRPTGPRTTERR